MNQVQEIQSLFNNFYDLVLILVLTCVVLVFKMFLCCVLTSGLNILSCEDHIRNKFTNREKKPHQRSVFTAVPEVHWSVNLAVFFLSCSRLKWQVSAV